MAVFEFRGILVDTGKSVRGVRDAENAKMLRTLLRKDGVLLTTAAEERADRAKPGRGIDFGKLFERASAADIAVMTRQLATLVGAKIPLFESLTALIEQVEQKQLKRVLTNVREQIREGTSLADAMAAHPRVFSPMYVNMVRAGEASGTLEAVLDRLTTFVENQTRLRGKVTAALAYPMFLAVVATIMVGVMMVYVVPKVTAIFESMERALPWYTQLLIAVSTFLAGYWWLLILLIAAGAYSFRRWKRTPDGRLKWDSFVLRSPIFGKLLTMIAIARFSRTLGTLLGAGVPLLSAMSIVRTVLGNSALERVVEDATGSIREGESIAEPLRRSGRFPPLVTHMIAIGERTGQLEGMLESVSNAYDTAVDTRVQVVTSLLGPMVIAFMGGTVAFIAMSILTPLMQMSEFVQ